jgi:hypothetical protein
MGLIRYDDGSTLYVDDTGEPVYSTPSTDTSYNKAVAGFSPSTVNPNASSWDEVLKYGISRTIDAVTRPVQLQNTYPLLRPTQTQRYAAVDPATGALSISPGFLILVGLVVVALKLAR